MNKSISKPLNKKLMMISLVILSLTLVCNTAIANAIPKYRVFDKQWGAVCNEVNELVPINEESGFDWSNPDKKAIYSNEKGHIFVLSAKVVYEKSGEEQQYITIDEYDSSVSYLNSKIVLLPYSCWGGFYNCEDGNFYIVVGQNNEEEDDKKIVYSVIKFNSEWKEIKRLNITGKESKTAVPFKLGKSNISFNKGILTIQDYRKTYNKLGLNNNEEEIGFNINTLSMRVQ